MADSIKVLQNIKNALPDSMKLLLINSIVLSHIHYPAILLTGISQSLMITLEKQLSWAVKATFNRKKYDSSSDLKRKFSILPINKQLQARSIIYFWRLINNDLPAFQKRELPTFQVKFNKRTKQYHLHNRNKTKLLDQSFISTTLKLWNELDFDIRTNKTFSRSTIKKKIKEYFLKNQLTDPMLNLNVRLKDFKFR